MRWYNKTYVCDTCDALVELTTKSYVIKSKGCLECIGSLTLISVQDATAKPTSIEKETPMETDNTDLTQDTPELELLKSKELINNLETRIQQLNSRSYTESSERNRIIDGVKEWALAELEVDSINETQAEELAEICGFELSKEFEAEVTVVYNVTVLARTPEDAESAIENVDFDLSDYDSDVVLSVYSDVQNIIVQ